jgi:hypothetical protein
MRCVGSMNPPCDRCAKAKRQCIITNRTRAQPSQLRAASILNHHHDERRRASEHTFTNHNRLAQRDDYRRSESSFPASEREATLPDRSTRSPEQIRQPSSQPNSTSGSDVTAESHSHRPVVLPSVYSLSPLNITADLESAYLDESPGEHSSRSGHGARSSVSTATTYGSASSDEIALTAVERDIYHLVDL